MTDKSINQKEKVKLKKIIQKMKDSNLLIETVKEVQKEVAGEEDTIIDTLGCGEVHAKLNALGPSEIYETRFAGVWLITHYNEESSIIGRFIEVTRFPDILKSQQEDMTISLDQLEHELEYGSLSDQTETDVETNT